LPFHSKIGRGIELGISAHKTIGMLLIPPLITGRAAILLVAGKET